MSDSTSTEKRSPFYILREWLDDTRLAIGFFTRLPMPADSRHLALAAHAFPLAGMIVGIAGAAAYAIAYGVGLSNLLAALLALTSMVLMTGGLHEDGLADFCDMLGVGGDREKRLAVLRDSRIGTYGVLGLGFSMAIKAAAIVELSAPDLVASALISASLCSRAFLPLFMRSLPLARSDGLGYAAGVPNANGTRVALILAFILVTLISGFFAAIVAMIASFAASFLILETARRKIGGYTGDVLGALSQVAELAILVNFAALS